MKLKNIIFLIMLICRFSYSESIYLQSYLTMFKATKDKRYLDKFIIHSKRVEEIADENNTDISNDDKKDSVQRKNSKWEWGISIGPTTTFYINGNYDADRLYPFEKSPCYSYGATALIGYQLSNHVIFLSGINFDNLEYEFGWNISKNKRYSYKYLSLPLLLDFSLGRKKFFVNVGWGLIGGIWIDKKNIYTNNGYGTTNIRFDNSVGAVMRTLKVGFNYRIKDNMKIFLAPQIYRGITTVSYQRLSPPPIGGGVVGGNYHLRYFKINLGILYTF